MVRINGELRPLEAPVLSAADTKTLVYSILHDEQKQHFEEHLELDASHAIPGVARFRVNVLLHNNGAGAVLRVIGASAPTVEQIELAPAMIELCHLPRGLVLVTGPTGSGKSTTLAAMVQLINTKYRYHVITIEDPIEFVYEAVSCIITQREVGHQTHSFNNALRAAMRQDPDVILVGEMRDLETIALALTAAETGHLVFATLHTADVTQTIDRIVDVFPPARRRAAGRDLPDAAASRGRQRTRGRSRALAGEPGRAEPDPRRQDAPALHRHRNQREGRHGVAGQSPGKPGPGTKGQHGRGASEGERRGYHAQVSRRRPAHRHAAGVSLEVAGSAR